MGDAARINLYGVFARFKDSIARTIASDAKEKAELANSTANTVKSEYEQFKTRNSYMKSLSFSADNVDIAAKSNYTIVFPRGVTKQTIIPSTSKFFFLYQISITKGNMTSVNSDVSIYAQINGSSSKRIGNSISNNSKIISNWQTVFYVTDIDNVSMITTTLNPSVSLTGASIVATITCIPISAETQSV